MALTTGGSRIDLSFIDTTALAAASIPNNRACETQDDGVRYTTGALDAGSGIALVSGNFANPFIIEEAGVILIATATNLEVGSEYLSTATASHVVPAAGNLGDEIKITWLDGTVMTLTSSSNISVTTDAKVTDTTWVFENFIQTLTLVDTSTEWEIK